MKQQFKYIQSAAVALLLGAMPAAHAVPTLSLQVDGGPAYVCADGAACDTNSLAGIVSVNQALGDFVVNMTSGLSKPLLVGGDPLMDLNTLNVQVSGAHTLLITFSDNNFDIHGGVFKMDFGGALSGAGASFEHSAYYDADNALFAQDTLIGQVGPLGPGGFGGVVGYGFSPDAPYSVTQVLSLRTAGGFTTFSGDFEVNVPEPTTLALLGLGLLGFAAVRRRRSAG